MFKVMVVDDEEVIVRGLVQLVPWDKYGCSVVATAASGREALDLVAEYHPDIMFTDINMPEMDGLALIAALRCQYPFMKISILTGYPVFEYAQQAIRMGVSGYLLKPSRLDQVEDALATMVAEIHADQQAGVTGQIIGGTAYQLPPYPAVSPDPVDPSGFQPAPNAPVQPSEPFYQMGGYPQPAGQQEVPPMFPQQAQPQPMQSQPVQVLPTQAMPGFGPPLPFNNVDDAVTATQFQVPYLAQPGMQTEDTLENTQNFVIKNAIKYMEDNYNKKISLQDVAEHVYVSQWHLSKLIAKNTQQNFSDILNGIRVQKAKELLKNPALRIWEISDMVGFGDVSHFSRIFKKYENVSANEFRNQLPKTGEAQ